MTGGKAAPSELTTPRLTHSLSTATNTAHTLSLIKPWETYSYSKSTHLGRFNHSHFTDERTEAWMYTVPHVTHLLKETDLNQILILNSSFFFNHSTSQVQDCSHIRVDVGFSSVRLNQKGRIRILKTEGTCLRWSTVRGRCCRVSRICCKRGMLLVVFEYVSQLLRSL